MNWLGFMYCLCRKVGTTQGGHTARHVWKFEIEVIENSAEEILDLVMEMNARIDGEWIEEKEDIELQEKYQTIYREWCQQQQYKESEILHLKVGTMFLRKNLFLLE